jgi:hypothetical protein
MNTAENKIEKKISVLVSVIMMQTMDSKYINSHKNLRLIIYLLSEKKLNRNKKPNPLIIIL